MLKCYCSDVDGNVVAAVLVTIKPIFPIFREYGIQNEENEAGSSPSHLSKEWMKDIGWAAASSRPDWR